MKELFIIIAGSRSFCDYKLLEKEMNDIIYDLKIMYDCEKINIISGTANGADKLGELYAQKYKYNLLRFPASWSLYGKSAGYIRNTQMADKASSGYGVLVAFWDGQSPGTNHMINIANDKKLLTYIIKTKNT